MAAVPLPALLMAGSACLMQSGVCVHSCDKLVKAEGPFLFLK